MLDFRPITLNDKTDISQFFYEYGGNSCQNSFVSSYLHKTKYDDYYCFYLDFLLIYRKGISNKNENCFLFPVGDMTKTENLKKCIDELFELCNEAKTRLVFGGITKAAVRFLDEYYKDKFQIEDNRNYYEYVFNLDTFINLPGKDFENRRWQLHKFEKTYIDRVEIRRIEKEDLGDIYSFHRDWLSVMDENEDLDYETEAIHEALEHFDELGLFGILIKVDGKLCGINIGSCLSCEAVDGIFLKGDTNIKYIYTMLFHEFAKICGPNVKYINGEEDLGLEGLRSVKMSYKPAYLIEKYIAYADKPSL